MDEMFAGNAQKRQAPDRRLKEGSLDWEFKEFALGAEPLCVPELEAFVEKWGGDAACGMKIVSSWEWAHLEPTPLWLAAMARSKACCVVLGGGSVSLSHPSGQASADAWRYAAFNGWAPEAGALFREQARQGPMEADWPALWRAVSQGFEAQGQGVAERAAGWIGALMDKRLGEPHESLLAALGSALGKAAPGVFGKPGGAGAGGWEALVASAQAHWGQSTMEQAEPALSGHPGARDAALAVCVSDQRAAQEQLSKMLLSFAEGKSELALRVAAAMAAQAGGAAGAVPGVDGWEEAKKGCKVWASSLAKLARQGAEIPAGALDHACAEGQWAKAYALALAGAKPTGQGEPLLWRLSKSRQQGTLVETLSGALGGTGGAADGQALDVAGALAEAGCRCSDLGPDGLDALQRLRSKAGSAASALMEAIGALGAQGGAAAPPSAGGGPRPRRSGPGPARRFPRVAQRGRAAVRGGGRGEPGGARAGPIVGHSMQILPLGRVRGWRKGLVCQPAPVKVDGLPARPGPSQGQCVRRGWAGSELSPSG